MSAVAPRPDQAEIPAPPERSLDPDDWPALRSLGHRMLDDMLDFLEQVRQRPVWRAPSEPARAYYRQPAPRLGIGVERVYQEFQQHVLPYATGNIHPQFWGWVCGTGTPVGMLADMLAGGMNSHAAFGDQAATHLERQVIGWLSELLGFPPDTSGLLVGSGSSANLTGLIVARDAMVPEILEDGASSVDAPVVFYASEQVHNSVDKALGIIGVGRGWLRKIPTDADYRIELGALRQAIAEDRRAGRRPACIIGSAGTVNTGAIDDLAALANIAKQEQLWLHVDAAFGAALALAEDLRPRLLGIERADSVAFDLHKWFYVQYDVACVLVRSRESHQRSFSPPASYLAKLDRGFMGGGYAFGQLGADLSRGFRALKVWMLLKEHGLERYGAQIRQNVAQARYLASAVGQHEELELAAPAPLNVVCFRYVGRNLEPAALNHINREVVMRLHERGLAMPSYTVLHGAFVIRVAITNHRTRREDLDALVEQCVKLGREVGAAE